jgi:hypothetical protein
MNAQTPASRPIRQKTHPENGSSKSENGGAVVRALNKAAEAMAQSLYQISASLRERQAESSQKYLSALQSVVPESAEADLTSAYQAFVDAVASQAPDRISEAQTAYTDLLMQLTRAATKQAQSATRDCVADFEDALAEAHKQGQKQYYQYVDTLKSVFAKTTEADLPPETLVMMAQNMASAAALSQGVFSHSE